MVSQNILKSDQAYKRGLVLGLTMAEIVLLLLFSLLLALSALLMGEEKAKKAAMNDRDRLATQLKLNQEKLRYAMEQLSKSDFSELKKELVRLEEQERKIAYILMRLKFDDNQNLADQISGLVEKMTKMEEVINIVDKAGFPKEPEKLAKMLDRIKDAGAEIDKTGAALKEAEARSIVLKREIDAINQDRSQKEGVIANMKRTLERHGKGTEKPACWADQTTGKPKYIYNAGLKADGIIVRHSETPPWAKSRQLPIDAIPYNRELSSKEFLKKAAPIFQWSEKNECRFFVRAYDLTGPTEKAIYKRQMRYLENVFYKYEVLDDNWK